MKKILKLYFISAIVFIVVMSTIYIIAALRANKEGEEAYNRIVSNEFHGKIEDIQYLEKGWFNFKLNGKWLNDELGFIDSYMEDFVNDSIKKGDSISKPKYKDYYLLFRMQDGKVISKRKFKFRYGW